MRYKSFAIIFFTSTFMAFYPALATTLFFDGNPITANVGENINLGINISPKNEKIFTVQAAIIFPINLLEAGWFRWSDQWISLPAANRSLISNNTETIYLTAGYPGGIDQPAELGTITFKTKATGTGNIAIYPDSFALNSKNQNSLTAPYSNVFVSVLVPQTSTPTPTAAIEPPVLSAPETQKIVFPPLFDVQISPSKTPQKSNLIFLIIIELFFVIIAGIIPLRQIWRQNKNRDKI